MSRSHIRPTPHRLGKVARVHVAGDVLLASQPDAADLAEAQAAGVRTVINLRHERELAGFDERRVVEGHGMTYVHIPFSGADELSDEVFDRVRAHLAEVEGSVLLHCAAANRVGAVWLAHRVLDGGLSWEEAVAEARAVGLRNPGYEMKARDYVERRQE